MSEETANAQEQVEQTENQPAGGSFEAITTQEQFDNRIKNRIARAESSTRKAVEAEYAEALEKARQFDELQEANKSELQKERERAEKAEQEVARLTHERELAEWAREAAEKHGVDASLLRGGTQEEIEAHAEQIKAALGESRKFAPVPSSGKPSTASNSGSDALEEVLRKAAGLKPKG